MSRLDDLRGGSWYEATARERIAGLLDPDSFIEIMGPEQRQTSPHLAQFDLPPAFDDGLVIGRGALEGQPAFVAAQEGRFMGGTFGEVHGAKLVGLLRAARDAGPAGPRLVLLLLDTGGVRLQEANAGEMAVSEIIRAVCEARMAGVAVIALIGGRAGAFGGGGIVTACCSRIAVSEAGRIGVTGPEVIETNRGVEEFDARDRTLVWRVTGGRTRALTGGADAYADDGIADFRAAALALAARAKMLDLATMEEEQHRLAARLARFGSCRDATEMWDQLGLDAGPRMSDLPADEFRILAERLAEGRHDAR